MLSFLCLIHDEPVTAWNDASTRLTGSKCLYYCMLRISATNLIRRDRQHIEE